MRHHDRQTTPHRHRHRYLGATHAICMAVLGYEVLGVDTDRAQDRGAGRRRGALLRAGAARDAAARPSTPGGCGSRTDLAEAGEFGDVHFVCVGTPQRPARTAADLTYVEGVVRDLAPYLRRRCLVVGKSTVPVGTAARLTTAAAGQRARRAPTSSWPGTPSSCARASPSRTRCSPDRLVFGVSVGRGRCAQLEARSRRCSRPAPRSSPRTCRPPSWSRSPRTRSWPPRSPTSTRWPRSARRPAPTCSAWPRHCRTTTASAAGSSTRARLRRRLPAQGHPGLHPPRRGARRRPVRRLPPPGRRHQQAPPASAPST